MDFGSLPRYPGGEEEPSPDHYPPPDQHGWEFAAVALLYAAGIVVVLIALFAWLLVFLPLGAGPGD